MATAARTGAGVATAARTERARCGDGGELPGDRNVPDGLLLARDDQKFC
jgi:hypothetical protein